MGSSSTVTYQLDPNMVIMVGYSAGAGLGALVAVTPGRLEPPRIPADLARFGDAVQGLVSISGVLDFAPLVSSQVPLTRAILVGYLHCSDPGLPKALVCPAGVVHNASTLSYLTESAPPVFFIQGAGDLLFPPLPQLVPAAKMWARATGSSAKVWSQLANAPHGISLDHYDLNALNRFLAAVAFKPRALRLSAARSTTDRAWSTA